ncbi:bifunctional 4-hydroxy-2-oxoglutarate aldolase/2-dehydro-3-deoxy-phosphogluconate aldolase [Microbacterium sp.]|uniref:bifunctional 4-hydroxy-2-oxoglutarate aldolase/2-dehydro-3-deoxy-phosphogluconate aldolase n=1 Tax=Microbacterium sp. TaxID=51671 RepID=UPI0039E2EA10
MPSIDELFRARPVMVILRSKPTAEAVELATRAWDLGIPLVEVPIQKPEFVGSLEAVVRAGRERGMPVGAGTVVSPDQLDASERAGAAFAVSPGLDLGLVSESHRRGLPFLPGVATATEVQRAVTGGLTWLKAFPAAMLTPAWFRTLRGPFPEVEFVATGGVDAENAQLFLDAGVRTVALGSALEDPSQFDRIGELLADRP